MAQKTLVMTTQEAIEIIIGGETLPQQIDYVTPGERKKQREAVAFLDNLPKQERKSAYKELSKIINDYYKPTTLCSDGQYRSAADFDAMF